MTISAADLRTAWFEVGHHGPIDRIVSDLREESGCKNLSRDKLEAAFQSCPLWKRSGQSNGHATYKHSITRVVVGWQAHSGGHNSSCVPESQAKELRDRLQYHINILGNEIFKYTINNWKNQPDYNHSLTNYNAWRATL